MFKFRSKEEFKDPKKLRIKEIFEQGGIDCRETRKINYMIEVAFHNNFERFVDFGKRNFV